MLRERREQVLSAEGTKRSEVLESEGIKLPDRTKARLIQLATELDVIALKWGK